MEQIIIHAVAIALSYVCIRVFLVHIVKHNSTEAIKNLGKEHIVLRLPKLYIIIGILSCIVLSSFLITMIFFPNGTEALWVEILFTSSFFIGIFLILEPLIWRIDVFRSEDYFIYRSIFGKTRRIRYDECLWYQEKTNIVILKTEKKIYYIDNKASNIEFLLSMMAKYKVKKRTVPYKLKRSLIDVLKKTTEVFKKKK